MNKSELVSAIVSELSGERTKRTVSSLSQHHRIQASKEFLRTINYMKSQLEDLGDDEAIIHEYIADGTKRWFDWNAPLSWDIEDGELTLIEPYKKNLCRFSEVPESICTHSKSTDSILEVVYIREGAKLDKIDKSLTEGKIILYSGRPREIIEELSELGVAGIIVYPSEQRAKGYLEMIQYVGFWPNAENVDKSTYGFSISRNQAFELIKLLEKGEKVKVHAKIKANLYKGKIHVLSTAIKGTKKPEEEIVLIAHICHPEPSANDNASGSALLLEIYRVLKQLIKTQAIETPERTIRFLWVPEFHGTIPWILEKIKKEDFKPIHCINLDMVGEHPARVGYPFTFSKTSISTPSFLNDLISDNIELIKDDFSMIEQNGWPFPWNSRIQPYSGGSDQILFTDEPLRIPAVMFGHSDTFHHTNLDTIDKVDSTTLKRVGILTTLTIIQCSYHESFLNDVIKAYMKGLFQRQGKLLNLLFDSFIEEKIPKYKKELSLQILESFVKIEESIIENIEQTFRCLTKEEIIKEMHEKIHLFSEELREKILKLKEYETNTNINLNFDRQVTRKWNGPINLGLVFNVDKNIRKIKIDSTLTEKQAKKIKEFILNSPHYGGIVLETLNLIDGNRTILEILSYLALSEWCFPDIEIMCDFFNYLEKLSLIEI
ncbi:MAG: DUF4910 domain-containing protein [Candidatus Heimdallarchaeaceae archaeon]